MKKTNRAILFHSLSVPVLIGLFALAAHSLPVAEILAIAQREIQALGIWKILLYPLLFAVCNALLLPGGILAMGAGLFFGLWGGWIINIFGSSLGAAFALATARRWGRGWVERKLHRDERWARLDQAVLKEGWKIIVLSQAHPLFPTSLLNYLYGLSRLPLHQCLLWIAAGQAPSMFFYAYLGHFAGGITQASQNKNQFTPMDWMLWIGGLLALMAMTALLAKIAIRLLAETADPN